MAKPNKNINIKIETSPGTLVDITSYVNSVKINDVESYRKRGGLLGWIAWKFRIKQLMWVAE